jgi:TrmH family RNA methyltransferase
MDNLNVVAVGPKYQQNLGYIARVAKNFGVKRLILVAPRCNHKGRAAIKYSKHASDLLIKAKVIKNIDKLDSDITIGTTGIWHKSSSSYYNIYDPKSISLLVKRALKANKKISLLIGREDQGLSRDELFKCDAIVFIGSNKDYSILNISHALAILLYELSFASTNQEYQLGQFYSDKKHQEQLIRLFDSLVKKKHNIKNKRAVSAAFRRIIRRSIPTKKEINAVSAALSQNERLG